VLGVTITLNLNGIAAFIKQTTGYEVFPSDIYYFNRIPAELNPHDVAVIVVSALCISIISGLYPAYRASLLKPVEALRYE
jgi:lipoprotein-releasing system permease protein